MKTILHITPFFAPNLGGVETHLSDLVKALDDKGYKNIVLTYSPLSTAVKAPRFEKWGKQIFIYRFPWIGHNLFYVFEKHPVLNFLYLTPVLLLFSVFWLLIHRQRPDVVHSHGLNGAVIGEFLKRLFGIRRHVVSIYSSYDNVPFGGLSTRLLIDTLNVTDAVLTQSDKSVNQLISLGVSQSKIHRYYHWIDLSIFKPAKQPLHRGLKVLFVGRMIPVKNALLLAKVAAKLPSVDFTFVGTGPDYTPISRLAASHPNIHLSGDIPYTRLNRCYQSADVLCLPSRYHEGWGRVLAESVACGAPVIASPFGGITEAVDPTVAVFTKPTFTNLKSVLTRLSASPSRLNKLQLNCRPYALAHYSVANLKYITAWY